MIVSLTAELIKISNLYKRSIGNVKIELYLSVYGIKIDLKGATCVDTSNLAAKGYLTSLKAEVDKIAVDQIICVPADVSKLRKLVDNDVAKNVYDELVTKVNDIDAKVPSTSGFVSKTHSISDRQNLEKKIEDVNKKVPNTSGLVKKTRYNTQITDIENKIPNVTCLVTNATLNKKATEIENKIPDITNLAEKNVFNTIGAEIENETPNNSHFINAQVFNRLMMQEWKK